MVIKKIKVFWKVIYLVTVYLVSFSTGISLKKYHNNDSNINNSNYQTEEINVTNFNSSQNKKNIEQYNYDSQNDN